MYLYHGSSKFREGKIKLSYPKVYYGNPNMNQELSSESEQVNNP